MHRQYRLRMLAMLASTGVFGADVPVISLTQVPCQILEAEDGHDYRFFARTAADCAALNAASAADRLAVSRELTLVPGRYIFRVTNRGTPFATVFWLREAGFDWHNPVHRATRFSVSGGGLEAGASRDFLVELKPGDYVYSDPAQGMPPYRLRITKGIAVAAN